MQQHWPGTIYETSSTPNSNCIDISSLQRNSASLSTSLSSLRNPKGPRLPTQSLGCHGLPALHLQGVRALASRAGRRDRGCGGRHQRRLQQVRVRLGAGVRRPAHRHRRQQLGEGGTGQGFRSFHRLRHRLQQHLALRHLLLQRRGRLQGQHRRGWHHRQGGHREGACDCRRHRRIQVRQGSGHAAHHPLLRGCHRRHREHQCLDLHALYRHGCPVQR